MLPLWFGKELLSAWIVHSMGMSAGVAYLAHVGGFLFGVGSMALIALLRIEEKYVHAAIEKKVTLTEANPVLEEALDLREQGDLESALTLLEEAWRRNRQDWDVALALWDTSLACKRPEAGVEAMKALVRSSSGDGDMGQALQHWMDLTRNVPTALVDSGTLIRLATGLLEQGDRDSAVRALRHCVDPGNSALSAGLALRAAEMARELDPPTALRAAQRALDFPDMHETKRARVRGLIGELEAAGVSVAPDVLEQEAALEEARAEARRPIEIGDLEPELPGGAQLGGPVLVPPPIPISPVQPPPIPAPSAARAPESGGRAPEDAIARGVMGAIDGVPRFAAVKLVEATPTSFESDTLRLRVSEGRKAKVEYAKIDAVAVALVHGLAPKPTLVIDLLLNWSESEEVPLRAIRLCSTGFDPRALIAGVKDPTEAYCAFVSRILDASSAVALPDPEAARGRPFRVFQDLASYQREVLQVIC